MTLNFNTVCAVFKVHVHAKSYQTRRGRVLSYRGNREKKKQKKLRCDAENDTVVATAGNNNNNNNVGNNKLETVKCNVGAVVRSNTAEDALLHRLLDANQHNLHSIPSQHHLGQILQLEIKLALKKIIKMVRSDTTSTGWAKKTAPNFSCNNLGKYVPILIMFSLLHSQMN